MSSADEMVHNMGRRSIATGAAKPFVACQTFDAAAGVVNATVAVERKSQVRF